MSEKPATVSSPRISLLVVMLLLLSLVPFSSFSLRNADASPPPVTTAISPTGGTGSPASLGTVITSGTSTVPTPLCAASCVITGGTRAGNNLFHSFGDFNIGALDSARFQTGLVNPLPDASVLNILARVTGGPSNLFGNLNSATYYPYANLFLMNPHGFLFGPNATVNVGGMVAFTTADYLKLSNGTKNGYFYADPAGPSLLTPAPVAAFGFLGSNAASIAIQGGTLEVPHGKTLAFIGGPRTFTTDTGTTVPSGVTMTGGSLSAPNGLIYLATVTSPGEIPVPTLSGAKLGALGPPSSDATVIRIRSGEFVMDHAFLTATNSGTAARSAIEVNVQGAMTLRNASSISTETFGAGHGSDVRITAQSLQMDGSSIKSTTTGDGHGGDISITNSQTVDLTNGAQIVSAAAGKGDGGDITVDGAESLTMSGFDVDGTLSGVTTQFLFNPNTGSPAVVSGIYSLTSGTKNGGAISITIPTLTMQDGAMIATINSGDGDGGNISINSTTVGLSNGASVLSSTGLDFTTGAVVGSGKGGNITISAPDSVIISGASLDFFYQSQISTQTVNSPPSPPGSQVAPAEGGSININAPNILVENGGLISSDTFGTGKGGDIILSGPSSALSQLSVGGVEPTLGLLSSIVATSETGSGGQGGQVSITASSVTLENQGSIQTSTSVTGGRAGDITLTVDNLNLQSGGSILSSGQGGGSSGHIQIIATDTVSVSGGFVDPNDPSTIFWSTIKNTTDVNSGKGTNNGIDIHGGNVFLTDGPPGLSSDVAQIESSTGTSGGTINITADHTISLSNNASILNRSGSFEFGSVNLTASSIMLNHSAIRGRTEIERNAGAISVTATKGNVELSNDSHILTNTLSSGDAGLITLKASNSVLLTGGSTIESSSLNGATGNAGSMTVEGLASSAQSVLIDGVDSGIFTTTEGTGAGGNIFVNANSVTLQNGGTLSATTSGTEASATGGTITVNANQVQLNNGGLITASTTGAGIGGTITVDATNTVTMTGGAAITANSTGTADAGSINITAMNGFTMQNSSITAQVTPSATPGQSSAGGGDIKITTSDAATVELINSKIIASVADGPGGGGNISIDPQFVILLNSQILAQAAQGQGGAITITAGLFLPDANSIVNADSGSGVNGTVTIQSPNAPASGKIQPLGKSPLLATSLLNQRCASLADGEFSSFTVAGRDSLPTEPGSWLTSPFYAAGMGTGEGLSGLSSLSGVSGVVRGGLAAHQIDQTDQTDQSLLSLRQIAPAGFLTQAFAVDWSASCQS